MLEPQTSLKFNNSSKPFRLYATLTGFPVNFTGNATEVIDFTYPIEDSAFFDPCTVTDQCDTIPCQGIVEDIVKRLRNQRTSGGYKFGDYADITPVISCMDSFSTSTLTYYTLSVCDTGDARALSFVEGQYPNLVIKRLGRKGSVTTYQTLSATAPADFSRTSVEIVPTCNTCPSGWNTITGGYIYVVTVSDGGIDLSSNIVTALTVSGVAPTVERIGDESGTDVGVYSVISSVTLNPTSSALSGFTIAYLGEKDTVCSDETTVTTPWVDGDSCDLAQDTYEITLMDTECGETRLEELQKAYPELSISIGASTQKSVFLSMNKSLS